MQNSQTDIAFLCSNPNVMVALVNSAQPYWAPVDRYDNTRFGELWKPLILLAADDHIRNLMDALAGLSTSEINTSLACGLRVDDDHRKIEIIIASDSDVLQATQDHIQRVWKEMVGISAFSWPASGKGDPRISQKSKALVRSLYEFCMSTFSKKFLKNISCLHDWLAKYHEWHEVRASLPRASWRLRMDELRSMVEIIEGILKDLSAYENDVAISFTSTDTTALDKFISTMDGVMERATSLLAINPGYSNVPSDWNPLISLGGIVNPLYIGCLRHCLEDLILFPQNIAKLREFYLSRHFAHVVNYALEVIPLNRGSYGAPIGRFPSGPHVWKDVYKHVLLEKGYKPIENQGSYDFSRIPTDPNELIVHPELKIATYLHIVSHIFVENSGFSTPPFNYISTSGLPCLPCAKWMSKLNSLDQGHGVEFRGTSYECPSNWRMPAMYAEKFSQDMKIWGCHEYLRVQKAVGRQSLIWIDEIVLKY
ncbi:hypothetical protein GALMADRAFT_135282 [Galerina marginata CBS 339.88]|uniref:Uncharacterized protein n=1 Tax=Galerina marginata (strain CBS 339.88) TaxID=685588 RepID=A0A067TSF7_GALM3|nr:hypothetical protein GALMADRAFT_135282 [Galerina marginata CBS 339.88]